ncbi:hypothetical protein M231_00584 [Tremella mesenterica]|uniref:Uncharacterized protein n=1 Tax=Tremella mesenterica TaxID=5217 RepID=A0A4Q1BVZ9_TREME|nr:hypothetical protein M231_00584 [Tremella mesenterica]
MDQSLFIFTLIFSFILLLSVIYCFLSTCLGIRIRKSDIWEALTLGISTRSRGYQSRAVPYAGTGGYDRLSISTAEEFEMMRRDEGRSGGFI